MNEYLLYNQQFNFKRIKKYSLSILINFIKETFLETTFYEVKNKKFFQVILQINPNFALGKFDFHLQKHTCSSRKTNPINCLIKFNKSQFITGDSDTIILWELNNSNIIKCFVG